MMCPGGCGLGNGLNHCQGWRHAGEGCGCAVWHMIRGCLRNGRGMSEIGLLCSGFWGWKEVSDAGRDSWKLPGEFWRKDGVP